MFVLLRPNLPTERVRLKRVCLKGRLTKTKKKKKKIKMMMKMALSKRKKTMMKKEKRKRKEKKPLLKSKKYLRLRQVRAKFG